LGLKIAPSDKLSLRAKYRTKDRCNILQNVTTAEDNQELYKVTDQRNYKLPTPGVSFGAVVVSCRDSKPLYTPKEEMQVRR